MSRMTRKMGNLCFVLLFLLVMGVPAALAARGVVQANVGREGETFEVKKVLSRGQTTLVDFYSPACPPCQRLAPVLEKLAKKRRDIKVVKLNINRPQAAGIDWGSPLAQQYDIKAVPFLMIFDRSGKLIAQGKTANEIVEKWIQEAGVKR